MSSYAVWQIQLAITEAMFSAMATYSLFGLVAVWGARGRGHWFWRLAAVLAFGSLWLFTADPRLCLFFLSQTAVVLLWLSPLRSRSDRTGVPQDSRYSLKDLLLALVLLSGLMAMLVRLPPQVRWDWHYDVLPGGVMGVFTLVAVWAVDGKERAWLRTAAIIVVFPALVMAGGLWLVRRARGPVGRTTAAAALLLIALLPARIYMTAFQSRLLAYPPPLDENGYVDLLRAADAIDHMKVDPPSGDAQRVWLQRQESALALLRKGLARRCQAVLSDTMNENLLRAEGKRIEELSQIAAARGRQALEDGSVKTAVQSYLADIELGAAIANGGVMMHEGFGFMSERLGIEGLQEMVAQLDDDGCRELAQRLEEIDARRESPQASADRERLYYSRTYPWRHRSHILERTFLPDKRDEEDILFEATGGEKRGRLRLLVRHFGFTWT